jgi:hypothetical protein
VGQIERMKINRSRNKGGQAKSKISSDHARHITLAARWSGEHLSQGRKRDGLPDVKACIESIIKQEARKDEKKKLLGANSSSYPLARLGSVISAKLQERRMKPYGFFVLLSLLIVYPMTFTVLRSILSRVPVIGSIVSLIVHPVLMVMKRQILQLQSLLSAQLAKKFLSPSLK